MHGDLVRARKLMTKRLTQEASRSKDSFSRSANTKSVRIYFMDDRLDSSSSKYHTDFERTSNHSRDCQYMTTVDQICSNKTKEQNRGWSKSAILGQCRFALSQNKTFFKHFCWRESSMRRFAADGSSVPKVDGFENISTHELNFNVNAVHKSRSEERSDVCGGMAVDHDTSRSPPIIGNGEKFVRRLRSEDLSYLTEKDMESTKVIAPSSATLKQFRHTSWSRLTHWLRSKLKSPDLPFPESFMGMHTYVLLATLFVLWTKLGMARTFFEHVVDTLIQVALLTLLMTTTVVIFEANDLTARAASVGKTCLSFLTSLTSTATNVEELQNHPTENYGKRSSDTKSPCGIDGGGGRRSDGVCRVGKEMSNLEEGQNPQQCYAPASSSCQSSAYSHGQKAVRGDSEIEPGQQFFDVGTMTEDDELLSRYTASIRTNVQTMTDDLFHRGIGTQTEPVCDVDGKEVVFRYVKDEKTFPEEVRTTDAGVQTDLDLKKIYEETERNRRNHTKSLKSLQRKYLAIRRCCQKKVGEMKSFDMHRGDYLAKLQLQLPALQQEKSSLIAERALIEKQFADEKKKNRDLVNRMTKLNQQFSRLSQSYTSITTPTTWRQQPKSNSSNFGRPANDQQQYTQQNTFNALGQQHAKIHTRQLMLPQPLCNTGSAHGRQMNGIQQQTNKVVQTPPQHPNVVQQPRLPIFQLLQNSILSNNAGSDASGFQMPCHQQPLSSSTKYSSLTNHQSSTPTLPHADQNATTNDCTINRTSSELASNS